MVVLEVIYFGHIKNCYVMLATARKTTDWIFVKILPKKVKNQIISVDEEKLLKFWKSSATFQGFFSIAR